MGRPEARVEGYLVNRAKALGGLCLKLSSQVVNGLPDRILILPGVPTCFVETKAPDGRLRKLQQVRHDQMRQAGATVYVASTRQAVDELLRTLTQTGSP